MPSFGHSTVHQAEEIRVRVDPRQGLFLGQALIDSRLQLPLREGYSDLIIDNIIRSQLLVRCSIGWLIMAVNEQLHFSCRVCNLLGSR